MQSIYRSLLTLLVAGMSLTTMAAQVPRRWFGDDQVRAGAALFQRHCAECHGSEAQGDPNWTRIGADGKYPPPPLNGTAHSWHHPLAVLRQTVRDGGATVGGRMPPFRDKLNADQIDSLIAFFQAKWPDQVYASWLSREEPSALPRLRPAAAETDDDPTRLLQRMLKDAEIGEAVPTPAGNILQVKVGSDYLYLTADGRFALLGELIDLEAGDNLTARVKRADNLQALSGFAETDMLVFPAQGSSRAELTVFTDTGCPECRKLHADVPQLQRAGVNVRYIPFPRGGAGGPGYADLRAVWCAADGQAAMNAAMGESQGERGKGSCNRADAVEAGYRLGSGLGIRATPALLLSNGRRIDGYQPLPQLLQTLGLQSAVTTATPTP